MSRFGNELSACMKASIAAQNVRTFDNLPVAPNVNKSVLIGPVERFLRGPLVFS
jgi:hypothetical protein